MSDSPNANTPIINILDKDKSPVNLQIRDAQMLATILGARFITTQQLAACFWQNTDRKSEDADRACRRRLNTLWDYGLLARIRPRAKAKMGSLPWIWAVTSRGVQILEHTRLPIYMDRLKKDKFDETNIHLPSQLTMQHSILVAEFGSRCLSNGGEWFFEGEAIAALDVKLSDSKSRFYYPDAVLDWPSQEGEKITWLLELERSANQRRFREKMNVWRSLRLIAKNDGRLGKEFVVMVGRISDTYPDRDERSLLPLARLLVKDSALLDFIKFIGVPDRSSTDFQASPMDAATFLLKHGG
ncbi:replication-relaxation family protein [Desulfosporosinus acidiphilus]|nr:replication-relaxation family protein [Desulfosporosinus acidiphilus]